MNKIIFCFLMGIAVSFSIEAMEAASDSTEATDTASDLEKIQSTINELLASPNEDAIKATGDRLYDFFQKNIYGKESAPSQYLEYFRAYRSFLLFVLDGSAAAAKVYAQINGQTPPDPEIINDSLISDVRLLKKEGDSSNFYDNNGKFTVKYKIMYEGKDIIAANEELDSQYNKVLDKFLRSKVLNRFLLWEIPIEEEENFWWMPDIKITDLKTSLCYSFRNNIFDVVPLPSRRKDLIGRCYDGNSSKHDVWATGAFGEEEIGWKIHVSAMISSASKIAELVIPILKEKRVSWKILRSIPTFRYAFYISRYYFDDACQVGKFIVIYPKSDAEAVDIATAIDQAFRKEIDGGRLKQSDFFPCIGDLKIGSTGGIFTRFDSSFSDMKNFEVRRSPAIIASQHQPNRFKDYKHPFGALGLSYGGVVMPQKVEEWAKFGLFGEGPSRPDAPFLTEKINPHSKA
jgi:hypothetical protein